MGAEKAESPAPAALSYADVADLISMAPMVMKAEIGTLKKVKTGSGNGTQAPVDYVLVSARVTSLIRGENGVAPTVAFLMRDVPKGTPRPAFLRKKQMIMAFARPGGRPGEIQLLSRSAVQSATPDLEAMARAITAELLKHDSPPAITGVGEAFHSAGTIEGEGETQIFLKAANGAPVSLSIVRRPGETPRWGVSLSEVVDEAAVPPERNTLLWYRLACGLPDRLPPEATRSLSALDAESAQRDYQLVMESLGSCGRTL